MFKMPKKIEYALPEKIGNPELFVGRKEEFDFFLGDWYMTLEGNFAQNQAILSRRKRGKSSFMQRLFNILWSAGAEKKEGDLNVIPFYYSIRDSDQTLGAFAKDFFVDFVCQYMSYKKRERAYIEGNYEFEELPEIIDDKEIEALYNSMAINVKKEDGPGMWRIASEAPATIGSLNGEKIVQIIDEFQYINEYVYDKNGKKIDRMSGTYMHVSEMREAPLIISGSEVHWLLQIVGSLTGRFQTYRLENLPKEEAKVAVERYATFMQTKTNQQAHEKIWELTMGDPLYIKALFMSRYNKEKDYTIDENIVKVYEKEIRQGEIYATWMEYMQKTFNTVNKANSKRIMLYLFNQGEERTRAQIIKDLKLNDTDETVEKKLNGLIAGDLISQGESAYDYTVTNDKTYELVFRRVYQKEIDNFIPDIKTEIRKMIGKDNYTMGKFAEFLIREKIKKPFNLKDICEPEKNQTMTPKEVKEREIIKLGVKGYEIDIIVECTKKESIWIDIKGTKNRYGKNEMNRWLKIVEQAREKNKNILFMVYSESGYTTETKETLMEKGVYIIK